MNKLFIEKKFETCKFGKDIKPVAYTDLPATITFTTQDTYRGQIKKETDTLEKLDYEYINPSTGPVYLNGAKPGDVLEVKIKSIVCESPAATCACPNEGLVGDMVDKGYTKILEFDPVTNIVTFNGVKVQATPMIGVMGVAPAHETIRTIEPGDHGGNMDTTLLCAGSTVYLPVQVEGALFALGDLHEAQGDGESFYCGLEASGTVEVEVNVRRDLKMDIPFVKTKDSFASIGVHKDTDEALKKSMKKLIQFIVDHSDWSWTDVGFFTGLFANLGICEVVDPLKTCRMTIPLDLINQIIKVKL